MTDQKRHGFRMMTDDWRMSPMDLLTLVTVVIGLGAMYGQFDHRLQSIEDAQHTIAPVVTTVSRIEERLAANERGDVQDREDIRDSLSDIKAELRQLRADLAAEERRKP